MKRIVRTWMGAALQTAQLQQLPLAIPKITTLNHKYNIFPDEVPNDGEVPALKYWGIGNKGHMNTSGVDGIGLSREAQFLSTNMDLYGHMPVALRLPDNDFSTLERERYRHRGIYVHKTTGVRYIAYWLRVIDTATSPVRVVYVSNDAGNEKSIDFVPNESDLSPTVPPLTNNGLYVATGDYIRASSLRTMTMTQADLDEYVNAVNIIYGDPQYAIATELMLVTGIDRVVKGDLNGATIQYKEAIATQAYGFAGGYERLFEKESTTFKLDVGASETMLGLTKLP